MEEIRIKENWDHQKLVELGYTYVPIEAGYVSEDAATIIMIHRSPYIREIIPYWDVLNGEEKHQANVEKLRQMDLLE